MKLLSLRTLFEIVGGGILCAAGFSAMYYIDCYREAGHIKAIRETHEQSILMLAAPLYECRAGKDWTQFSFEVWQRENPDCDSWCAINELAIQLRNRRDKQTSEDARVAEK